VPFALRRRSAPLAGSPATPVLPSNWTKNHYGSPANSGAKGIQPCSTECEAGNTPYFKTQQNQGVLQFLAQSRKNCYERGTALKAYRDSLGRMTGALASLVVIAARARARAAPPLFRSQCTCAERGAKRFWSWPSRGYPGGYCLTVRIGAATVHRLLAINRALVT